MAATKLRILMRDYCHLCHDMATALAPLAAEFGCQVEEVDVDADEGLVALYDELVPVLLHDDKPLCHYFLDEAKVREYLSGIR